MLFVVPKILLEDFRNVELTILGLSAGLFLLIYIASLEIWFLPWSIIVNWDILALGLCSVGILH